MYKNRSVRNAPKKIQSNYFSIPPNSLFRALISEKVALHIRFMACWVPPCISAPPGDSVVMVLLAALLERT